MLLYFELSKLSLPAKGKLKQKILQLDKDIIEENLSKYLGEEHIKSLHISTAPPSALMSMRTQKKLENFSESY